jgi:NAD(P)-dependent dehydrogenase (short-subunit alcohol dehydrogenase family)
MISTAGASVSLVKAFAARPGHGVIAPYSVSKAALTMTSLFLAMELAKDGVLFRLIHPGMVDTDSNRYGEGRISPQSCAPHILAVIDKLDASNSSGSDIYDAVLMTGKEILPP